jgi:glycosyltransferase involved in cell wall biosynthesis
MGWFPDQPGGLTRYLRDQTEAWAARAGNPPRAVVIGPVADHPAWVRTVSRQDELLPLRLLRFARAVAHEARSAEIVDGHFALYTFPCLFVPKVRRLPLVVHFHGPWADEFVANGQRPSLSITLKRRLERSVYRRARVIVVLSESFKRVVVERFGISPERVHVLGGGVDLETFTPGDRAAARARLGIADSTWVAVTARRLDPRMGVDVLLRAWSEVAEPGRLLLVVGDGPQREDLESAAAALGLEGRVRFLGRVSDDTLVDCYRAADVSVVPSLALEGFGLVVLEALACGTAVIGTDAGGIGETLRRLDPSLIVPAGDAVALAARLTAARSGDQALPPPSRCREFAEEFSWDAVALRHERLYQYVMAAESV